MIMAKRELAKREFPLRYIIDKRFIWQKKS